MEAVRRKARKQDLQKKNLQGCNCNQSPSEEMRSSSSSKQHAGETNRGLNSHLSTLHERLFRALNLGFGKSYGNKGRRKWKSTDIEMQKLVVRSISAFLDCISADTLSHPLVKESVAHMVDALEGILMYKSLPVLTMAANAAVKLVSILPSPVLQSHDSVLLHPLSSLLIGYPPEVSTSCATAMNIILSNINTKNEKEVWEILEETEAVVHIVSNMHDFSSKRSKSVECFQKMASLLTTILWRWPSSRYSVWNDEELMQGLEAIRINSDLLLKVAILKLYSALALCCNGAKKLLENGESVIRSIVECMDSSNDYSIRAVGVTLAQSLVIGEQECLKMLSFYCEPFVKAIVNEMRGWSTCSRKVGQHQLSLLVETCRLALITCWAGNHHKYFWKFQIDRVLLDLLVENSDKFLQSLHTLSLDELTNKAQVGLNVNLLPVLRPYIWDILGWLAAHCDHEFSSNLQGNESINILITCSCLTFADSIHKGRLDSSISVSSESVSRAVLMMVYSPSKCIQSRARNILYEILKPRRLLQSLLASLKSTPFGDNLGMFELRQTSINLVGLVCYSGLPLYRDIIIKRGGLQIFLDFMRWCLRNHIHLERLKISPHFSSSFLLRNCCYSSKDWEGRDFLLLLSLWGLGELIHHFLLEGNKQDLFSRLMDCNEDQFLNEIQEICCNTSTPGVKWYAAYVLSFFGQYGFPCKIGTRLGKALIEKEYADMNLVFTDGDCVRVHGVVLLVRCPTLLPPGELPVNKLAADSTSLQTRIGKRDVRLSSHVEHHSLSKLLEYIYFGYLEAGDELVKKLKAFARHCNLEYLALLLRRKAPVWGTVSPSFDFTPALGPAGIHFSDIILEAKDTGLTFWSCCFCSSSLPHIHAHKVILLCGSCGYLQAVFHSGMQESLSDTLKAPVSWEALVRLVHWFYSDEMPKPPTGCLWDNMGTDEKLNELKPYVELLWLAEFWCLGDLEEDCYEVIISHLDSARNLSVKLIQIAADLSRWKLAEVAAKFMAPLYRQLHDSGELDTLDEELVDMVRAASVKFSQEGHRL